MPSALDAIAKSTMRDLPMEMVLQIFENLPLATKKKARLVCHYWRLILDTWAKYAFRPVLTNKSIDFVFKSYRKMDVAYLYGLSKPDIPSMTFSRNKYPKIRVGVVGERNSGAAVLSFMKYGCVNAELIHLKELAFKNVGIFQISQLAGELRWENLSTLEINVVMVNPRVSRSRKLVSAMTGFLDQLTIPYLKKFLVNLNHASNLKDNGALIQKFGTTLFEFIGRHGTMLNEILWVVATQKIQNGIPSPEISDQTLESLGKMKLNSLQIVASGPNALSFVLPSIHGSEQTLTALALKISGNEPDPLPIAVMDQIGQIFQKNFYTLKNVKIRTPVFDMHWLHGCYRLESLSIEVGQMTEGLLNVSTIAVGINFPGLKYFNLEAFQANLPLNFDDWLGRFMANLEKIRMVTYFSYLTVPVLQSLVGRLRKLKEIEIEADLKEFTRKEEIKEFCGRIDGLEFHGKDEVIDDVFVKYAIQIKH